jgi:hypothetical protein
MQQKEKCLENIKLARTHGYANEVKLKQREDEALKQKTTKQQKVPENFFKLSYPANERNPSIVNCLEVKKSEKFGHHVVTNRNLNPGDVIAVEEPIFKEIKISGRYVRCSNCLKSNMLSLIPCDVECTHGKMEKAD